MLLTIDLLLSNPQIVKAVIDRSVVTATEADRVHWRDYLDYDQANPDGTFKTFIGNQTGVVVGTFIDRYSNKPIRKRHSLGSGIGEVACLGDAYQMTNERLEKLQILIDTYNRTPNASVINEIVDFLVDDLRQCTLAPHKAFDKMNADLRFTGTAKVSANANNEGVTIDDITIPINIIKAAVGDKNNIVTFIRDKVINALRPKGCSFDRMEMNLNTFQNRILGSSEFKDKYRLGIKQDQVNPFTLLTPELINPVLSVAGIPRIVIREEWIQTSPDTSVNVVPDDKISFVPAGKIGRLMWKRPYEMVDNVPGKQYTSLEDGKMFIASKRTEEGRFMEYGMEGIVSIEKPTKMAILDLSDLG